MALNDWRGVDMNWYNRLKYAQFGAGYGEHWIDESGNLMYADGDIGDMNHEAHVIQSCQAQIADESYNQREFVDWDGFLESIGQELLNTAKNGNGRYRKLLERKTGQPLEILKPADMVGYGFVENELVNVRGVDKDMMDTAMGRGDARIYGMKVWGWKRVMNNHIQSWSLTDKDVQIIARGIGELAPEDENGDTTWNIECINPRRYYTDIPLKYIDMGLKGIQSWEAGELPEQAAQQQSQQQSPDAALTTWQNRTSD